jgi:hypothetical protein
MLTKPGTLICTWLVGPGTTVGVQLPATSQEAEPPLPVQLLTPGVTVTAMVLLTCEPSLSTVLTTMVSEVVAVEPV